MEQIPAILTVAGSTVLETAVENYIEFAGVDGGVARFILHAEKDASILFRTADGTQRRTFDFSPQGIPFDVAL